MSISVLFCDKDHEWTKELEEYFKAKTYECESINSGKECQSRLYKKKFTALVLDFDIEDYSAISVLRYVKMNQPAAKIILTISDIKILKEIGISKTDLKHLGVFEIVQKPSSPETIFKLVELYGSQKLWESIEKKKGTQDELKIEESDEKFPSNPLSHFPKREYNYL